jgi:putative ABC transport system permease protein
MQNLLQDIRYGLRVLWRSPGVTFAAVLALALGIGANTAIFSLVNAVVLRPLPYAQPERLVLAAYALAEAAPANFLDWRKQNQSFEDMAAVNFWSANLNAGELPERLEGFQVTPSLFALLGVQPIQGRTFTAAEEQPGNDAVVLLSYGLWQRRFGSDPQIIGKTLTINARSFTVVGVMPPDFQFYRPADVWAPLAFTPQEAGRRTAGNMIVLARLKPGVTMAQAQADMTGVARRLEQQYPATNTGTNVRLVSLHDDLVGPVRLALLILLGAVVFVLLIACANIANLLLARAVARQKEVAIRAALGASRKRLIQQLLTESVLLGLLGGACGLLLASWAIQVLSASIPPSSITTIIGARGIRLDVWMLGFTLLISLLTGIVFGLAPALQISRPDLNETLKEGGRGTAGSFRGRRLRSLLVVSEMALSVLLLIGAGLMIKSFLQLLRVNPGFDPHNVLTMEVSLLDSKYVDDNQINSFYQQTLERIKNLPGVQFVGMTSHLPLGGNNRVRNFDIEGQAPAPPGQSAPLANYRITSPDFFRALSVPLLKGRFFNEQDTSSAPGVAIINETMANRYWPDQDPIGKRVRRVVPGAKEPLPWLQIVGVVKAIRHISLQDKPKPELYVPYQQNASRDMTLVLRTASDPLQLVSAVRNEVGSVDKDQPLFNINTMEQVVNESMVLNRFSMYLLAVFSIIALVLAAVGIYGVMSYSVTQRRHEIGVRIALGAQRTDVIKMIVKQGMGLALLGVGIGLLAALGLMRLIASLLYGVSANDLLTFGATALLLSLVALMASYFPALRATKVDPIIALRYE